MPDKVHCETHGECEEAFVCTHLSEDRFALGFNRSEPSEENLCPDAWCDDCEVIWKTYGGWNDESEKLVSIRLVCSYCYETIRIRNTRTDITLDDLAGLRWKCDSCEEWHHGPVLDVGYDAPIYWSDKDDSGADQRQLSPDKLPKSFLNDDFCIIEGEDFFVRGVIKLPIIGTMETFRWGVWGSLSEANFKKMVATFDDPRRVELEPMFSWLSNEIDDYGDTVNLKMFAHIENPDNRPVFELELTDHPLSQEYHHGISAQRVKEIMMRQLKEVSDN